ncbi:glycosyltransferase family 4 protein [Eudoraea adriatica]|uniref:glycosyltransferase family 4 protein n=1 Tax=Eudoraea adriatica TaxID=446681 RepID=UPI00037FF7F8|nr:glycosyltransferase family 4 protein [Eudoraea adriatica]
MRLKILVFHPALATYRVDFFNSVDENFDAKFFFEYKEQASHKFSKNYLQSKCTFKSNYLSKGFELFGRSIRFGINSIIRKERPNVIICSEFGPVTILVFLHYILTRNRFKLYTICDDSLANCIDRKGIRSIVRNLVSKNIDGIIFPSHEVCEWYQNNISVKPKTLILPIIHNDKVFRAELLKSLNIANRNIELCKLINKKVILYLGRLVEVKNLFFLIKVISKLKELDWILVIVGKGEMMNNLKNQVVKSNITDKVHFTGFKEGPELLAWYNIAQLFVLPSTFERFGAVVNEALLAGCPVLCSEIAGASTLITNENGKLFSPYEEIQLAAMLELMLQDISPIKGQLSNIRKSKMPFTFDEKIKELFEKI